ncbi:MAG TPA: LuxR C-terminal-related transcriptional regulator [Microvirga sp.]|jgi:FixJ family two-component response regulator|nr:LuxR C-terminal-related transcriptional regulator [Microvirga sp.]
MNASLTSGSRADRPIVSVVDDDRSTRDRVEALVRSAGWQPQTFASARDYLAGHPAAAPNCLVLDINPPDADGRDLLQHIFDQGALTPVILVTRVCDVPMTVRAMKAGAVEVLTKPLREDALLSAVAQALDRSRATLALKAAMASLRDLHSALSPRERQVMTLVVSGFLNKQIAFELGISEITVKAHRGRLMRKMQAGSLADLVTMAADLGIARRERAPRGGSPRRIFGAGGSAALMGAAG